MITQPSIPRLLASMREELIEKVIPAIDDPTVVVSVEMMTEVLNALSVRTEHEIEWMRQECDAIEVAANDMASSLADATDLQEALATYQANRASTLLLSEVQADYQRASEVLSRLTEAVYATGDATAIDQVQALFDARLATEQAAIGTFIAVGRD